MSDFYLVFSWWFLFFGVGLAFLPLTTKIFASFADQGYIFAKILGVAVLSYLVFLLGSLKILPFRQETVWFLLLFLAVFNYFTFLRSFFKKILTSFFSLTGDSYFTLKFSPSSWAIFAFEEILFFLALFFWAYIRAHEPSIHGLEKFMDFGFINSLLRSEFFPPKDLWLTPHTINYYYFGHLVTAVLTKLSGIPPEITFNLMMAALFGLTFVGAFSLGLNLFGFFKNQVTDNERGAPARFLRASLASENEVGQNPVLLRERIGSRKNRWQAPRVHPVAAAPVSIACGLLSAFLVTLGGNLHTFYAFTRGFEKYWYPDATRLIPYTIHEFPSYSWVVSDLHGHVLDIPFVLLAIALLLSIISKFQIPNSKQIQNLNDQNSKLFRISLAPRSFGEAGDLGFRILLLALVLAVMYMTNAWDGIIYLGLTSLVILYLGWQRFSPNALLNTTNTTNSKYYQSIKNARPPARQEKIKIKNWSFIGLLVVLVFTGSILFSLPFTLHFKPFASGLHLVRDHSPLYMLAILWGFFYFFAVSFILFLWKIVKQFNNLTIPDIFILALIFISTLLLIFPEVAYIKDIYPLHYRANTMFKLGYQAFIMLSISSAYIFIRIISSRKNLFVLLFFCSSVFLFTPIAIYPYFAVRSYYNGLKSYQGLNGASWLKNYYPADYQAIKWLQESVNGQPVILEAVGDSYTDYARVSSFTGLPTVVGWPVHEWLWRGSYDEAGKRTAEVRLAYGEDSLEETKEFLKKYQVKYVFVGALERQKYPQGNFGKWVRLGKVVFQAGSTQIYEVSL